MSKIENLILCPLKPELNALLKGLKFEPHVVGRISGYLSHELKCFFASGGHGKVAMALTTQYLLTELSELKRAFCVGVSGSLNSELGFGELIVAEKIIEHDFKVGFIKRKPPQFRCDEDLVQKARQLKARTGIICSGDEDICSQERATELRTQFGGDAVAWEGAGFARACRQFQLPFLEVRAISDSCEMPENFEALLEEALISMRIFIRSLLEQVQEAPP